MDENEIIDMAITAKPKIFFFISVIFFGALLTIAMSHVVSAV